MFKNRRQNLEKVKRQKKEVGTFLEYVFIRIIKEKIK